MVIDSPAALEKYCEEVKARKARYPYRVSICGGTGCQAFNCLEVYQALEESIKDRGLEDRVEIKLTGCHGFCEMGPLMYFQPQGHFYVKVDAKDVDEIVRATILEGGEVEKYLYKNPVSGEIVHQRDEVPFYKKQKRLLLGFNHLIRPQVIDDYIALDGYKALAKVLYEMAPEEVIEAVEKSGLRGRGGAGFPTARKWRICREAQSPDGVKYIICNADEGDPGAYMDRSLLEGNPHAVIEGMAIGAYAIGACEGYVYVRHEYPLALRNLLVALDQAREMSLLGKNIMGSGFDFDIKVAVGGGAFVCGEETALIASIEGKRGMPRPRPPYPAIKGLWDRPTNINNVETWENVPLIIRMGPEKFAEIGTETSKGTKIFSLVGKINNTGLVEVPMGITMREIVYDIGGGIPGNKAFKAVQTGGPSGGCIPSEHLDIKVDFESLQGIGSMMGSGGMIVMDENTCMVDIAKYFMKFLCEESCGKCVPCRIGTKRMLEILTKICDGKGTIEDLEALEVLAADIKAASLCALGGTAPNPVLTTLKYFRHEYEEHIYNKRCPAGVCPALIDIKIDPERCNGCGACAKACPVGAISGEKKSVHTVDPDICIRCKACLDRCPRDAIFAE